MKRYQLFILLCITVLSAGAQNPYLPLWEHLPDGEPRVFEDPDQPGQYRAYIVGSHDMTYTAYCGNDIRLWSAPVDDLSKWRDEGPIFSWYVDGLWDTMFAPDLVETVDKATGKKTYWLYPHSRGRGRIAMVCKGDRPDGPFTPVNLTPDGIKCVEGSLIDFDPSVFVEQVTDKKDPDYAKGFRAYVYYGFKHSRAYELNQENMYAVRPGTQVHDYFLPASKAYGELCDPPGTIYPALFKDQKPGDFNFFEASSIRQVGNKYVMVFSGYSGPEYGLSSTNSTLRYAYGDSPLGPWRSGGVLVDSRGVVPNKDGTHLTTTNGSHNTHGSLQEINGQWYVFYHRPPRGYKGARQSMVAPVKIEWEKKKVADGGRVRITAYDPYAPDNEWSAKAADGMHYTGAEVTSEGFQIYGLPPYRYYSAGIAAYMTGNDWLQDNHDNWNDHMDLAGITNGGIIGFKYFGFGGLSADTKGVKAFEGAKQDDGTVLNLFLTPNGKTSFKIHVMLDGPYANSTWNGREIGVVTVPDDAAHKVKHYKVAVPAVEGLAGKHAIYLVAEGGDGPLFDLQGIGFSKTGVSCERPKVPVVTITIDGVKIPLSDKPILATRYNGYTDASHYQVYAPLTDHSVIRATASSPEVQIEVGTINEGRAKVTCTYKGQKKTYLIN